MFDLEHWNREWQDWIGVTLVIAESESGQLYIKNATEVQHIEFETGGVPWVPVVIEGQTEGLKWKATLDDASTCGVFFQIDEIQPVEIDRSEPRI